MSIAEKLTTIAENQQNVYEAGRNAQYDAFWDAYQQNGTLTNYLEAFAGRGWTDELFKPKHTITAENTERMFHASGIKHIETDMLDMSKATIASYMFADGNVEHIGVVDLSNVTVANGVFYYVLNLHTIDKLILNANGATHSGGDLIQLCPALRNVTIEGTIAEPLSLRGCNVLSRDSITSIVNALSTTTSGLSLTIPQTAVVNAFGSTTAAAWTTLIGTRKNWTISLA